MKIDLHVHSSEVSLCGHIPGTELVRLYREAGYDAIVLTNHFNTDTADAHAAHSKSDFAQFYLDAYHLAQTAGDKLGLRVFCGFEIRFDENSNDYLVYGLPDDLVQNCRSLFAMTARDFGELARQRGFLFYQAHPFRDFMSVTPPDALFGIEIQNGHPRHDSRNDIAAAWAKKYHLHAIGGSDAHQVQDVGTSGILTPRDVRNMDDLVAMLRADDYQIIYER